MRRNAILGVLAGALLLVLVSGVALAATERGTRGDDLLVGRNGDDRLKALEGFDVVSKDCEKEIETCTSTNAAWVAPAGVAVVRTSDAPPARGATPNRGATP